MKIDEIVVSKAIAYGLISADVSIDNSDVMSVEISEDCIEIVLRDKRVIQVKIQIVNP